MTATTDLFREVRQTLEQFVGDELSTWIIGGQPVPASRPRVSRWGVYYSKRYGQWRKDSWQYAESLEATPSDRPIVLMIEAIFEKARTSKLDHPHPDVDNLVKGPMDLMTMTEKVWGDDRQVVLLIVGKRFAEAGEEPGFRIYWQDLEEDNDSSD